MQREVGENPGANPVPAPEVVSTKPSTSGPRIEAVIKTFMVDFSNNIATKVHPCWKMDETEASMLIDTGMLAYPDLDFSKFAKIMFWGTMAIVFVPRFITTITDILQKLQAQKIKQAQAQQAKDRERQPSENPTE